MRQRCKDVWVVVYISGRSFTPSVPPTSFSSSCLHCRGKPTRSVMTNTEQTLPSGGQTCSTLRINSLENLLYQEKNKNQVAMIQSDRVHSHQLCLFFFQSSGRNTVLMLLFHPAVAEGRRGDTSWQHSHQDREPKPVCASFHQPARGDWDTEQGRSAPCSSLLCFFHEVTWIQNINRNVFMSTDPTAESSGYENSRTAVSSPRKCHNRGKPSGNLLSPCRQNI